MAAAAPAVAASHVQVDVPAATLGEAVIRLAEVAKVTIGISDPKLVSLPTPALHGHLDVDAALARLLQGLPARAERIDAATWRVVAAPSQTRAPARREQRHSSSRPSFGQSGGDIIVTGSKTGTRFDRYAGTASIVDGGDLTLGEQGMGSDALVQRMPSLASTHLGSGRNKLFIRGIADSSFNGPSQAVVGEYLGDVRLNYNAPDPDISLYDVRAVEVIEGPQGTLYGAGALGGIIRIVPEPVDLDRITGSVAFDGSATAHGGHGHDLVGLVNLPIVAGQAAVRVVGFKTVEGGYIDDVGRHLSNVNRTDKEGGRATVDLRPGLWRVELGLLLQNVTALDGQYAERGFAPLTRSNRVAQPFDNDYLLSHVTVARDWGKTSFVSASAFVLQQVDSRFDFTPPGAANPRIYDQANHIDMLSNETRLSRLDSDGRGWVIGASLLHDRERLTRAVGNPASPIRILGISNSITEGALFGEAGVRLTRRLLATAGARIEYTHLVGAPLDRAAEVREPRRDEVAVLPSLSFSWQLGARAMLFARYQEGLRPGGLAVTPGQGTAPTVERFRGDSLSSMEGGAKLLADSGGRLQASVTFSYAHWENIQADLVNLRGMPYTANIGTGRIWGMEGALQWRPIPALGLSAAVFANDSRLIDILPNVPAHQSQEIPNVAHIGMSGKADFRRALGGDWQLHLAGSMRYTGRSRLGGRPDLYISQGNYVLSNASARIGTSRWGVSIQADNLLDERRSTFALGDPYGVADGSQIVPPRPRTMRLGVDGHF